MRKFFILSLLLLSQLIYATGDQTTESVSSDMVQTISDDVQLSAEQSAQLTAVAKIYVAAIQSANQQYANDDYALVAAKAAAWQEYRMQLRSILSDSQYAEMQQKQQARRQAVINRINQEAKQ